MTKTDEELRNLILARRARFVAAAMGTSGVLASCAEPSVCLSPIGNYSTEETWTEATTGDTFPSVCLSPTSGEPETMSSAKPSVCLEPAWTSEPSQDAGADGRDAASSEGTAEAGAGTSTDELSTSSVPGTSGSPSESTSAPSDASTSVPTPCLSPPFMGDVDLDSLDASASGPGSST